MQHLFGSNTWHPVTFVMATTINLGHRIHSLTLAKGNLRNNKLQRKDLKTVQKVSLSHLPHPAIAQMSPQRGGGILATVEVVRCESCAPWAEMLSWIKVTLFQGACPLSYILIPDILKMIWLPFQGVD